MDTRHFTTLAVLLLGAALSGCGGSSSGQSASTRFTLTVNRSGTGSGTVTGGGISCGATCTATLESGTRVTLTATAGSGSTFSGWSGDCSGTGSCTVSMTAARAVAAAFAAQPVAGGYVVAMVQSEKAQATDLTAADVAALVQSAVAQAGGLDFIHDGDTVVLKPNLLTAYSDGGMTPASVTVNGIDTGLLRGAVMYGH